MALMDRLTTRCSVCKRPATRKVKLMVIIGEPPVYCDDHDYRHTAKGGSMPFEMEDLEDARLVRACNEYLSKTEMKT
jgi:hypothetical protein